VIRVTNSKDKDMSTMDPLDSQRILPAMMLLIIMLVETVVERDFFEVATLSKSLHALWQSNVFGNQISVT